MNKLQDEKRAFKVAFDYIALSGDFFFSDEDVYQFQVLHPEVWFSFSSSCLLKLRKRQISNFLGIKSSLGLQHATSFYHVRALVISIFYRDIFTPEENDCLKEDFMNMNVF